MLVVHWQPSSGSLSCVKLMERVVYTLHIYGKPWVRPRSRTPVIMRILYGQSFMYSYTFT